MRFVIRLGLILLVLGVVFLWLGLKERSIASQASQAPEKISLAKLLARGVEGNPNIILTGFVPCENYVYQQKDSRWTGAWVPVVPFDGGDLEKTNLQAPKDVKALIFTIRADNEQELYKRCAQRELPALVVNRIVSLESEQKKLLEERYPGVDFDKCLIIQEGREPASDSKLLVMIGGGGAAALLGLCLTGFCGLRMLSNK